MIFGITLPGLLLIIAAFFAGKWYAMRKAGINY